MVEASQRAIVRGPTFIRLLAGLADVEVSQPGQSLPDRLSQWIDWTHSVALSTALDSKPSAATPGGQVSGTPEHADCARVRDALAAAIAGDPAFSPAMASGTVAPSAGQAGTEDVDDYPFFRHRHLLLQQTMEANIGGLRRRLRDRLALGSADMARLAALDAVMERALGRRERALLSAAPALLGKRFERLRLAAKPLAADAPAADTPAAASGDWLDLFRRDMRSVLLAELELRFQPVEGLLAALRTHSLEPPSEPHAQTPSS